MANQQVAAFVDKLCSKLVDMTMRNRLLNHKHTARGAAIELVNGQPTALWDAMWVNKDKAQQLQLRALLPEDTSAELDRQDEPASPVPGSLELSTGEAREGSSTLDAQLRPEELRRRAHRLDELARLSQEEQGVDTLFLALGFLAFYEDDQSDLQRLAPLVLLPVTLSRQRSEIWKVKASGEEPIANPALVEYLHRKHRLELLPLNAEVDNGLATWLSHLEELIAPKKRWAVQAGSLLGTFSFQKFVMHQDLKKNAELIVANALIERLALREGSGSSLAPLPADIAQLELDADFVPETTHQVMDADSTQQRALAAVLAGHDLVIQGPPGTGKSQTIANLIAMLLAAGKSVLFVAEKQAALNVVFDRLERVGLRDFCLALHSSKALKTEVVKELRRAFDAMTPGSPPAKVSDDLRRKRGELTAYVKELHREDASVKMSPRDAMGRLPALAEAESCVIAVDPRLITRDQLRTDCAAFARLAEVVRRIGEPGLHPWRNSSRRTLDLQTRERVTGSLEDLTRLLPQVLESAVVIEKDWGLRVADAQAGATQLKWIAKRISGSPGVSSELVARDTILEDVEAVRGALGRAEALRARVTSRPKLLAAGAAAEDLRADADLMLARKAWWNWISGSWRAARRRLFQSVVRESWKGPLLAAAQLLELLALQSELAALSHLDLPRLLLGPNWRGTSTDTVAANRQLTWIAALRQVVNVTELPARALPALCAPSPDAGQLRAAAAVLDQWSASWRELCEAAALPQDFLGAAGVTAQGRYADTLRSAPQRWREWTEYLGARDQLGSTLALPFLTAAENGALLWGHLAQTFEKRLLEVWLDGALERAPVLRNFSGPTHDALAEDFRKLDLEAIQANCTEVAHGLRRAAQHRLQPLATSAEMKVLRDQFHRARGLLPTRRLIQDAFAAVRTFKPCFLMSPMTVAQMLTPGKHDFDVVIFDEASQLTPEDSAGAVARGRQLVVVGDSKQLPPTNFFAAQSEETEPGESGEDGQPVLRDLESVLELAEASGFHRAQLRWHYRSRHESLIAFSNARFYEGTLFTFPSPDTDRRTRGLRFEHVPDGVYEGGGQNRIEARRVAEAVALHARRTPEVSLGVGTFSQPQRQLVSDELERLRGSDPTLAAFLDPERTEPFFVKNLENIQGDEREVIFLSVTYGRGADGKVRANFGPLGGESGWRRLNVLVTRARMQMRVFSSMRAEDLEHGNLKGRGAELIREFLTYAETGSLAGLATVKVGAEVESPLEQQVASALMREGVKLHPQVGVAGYRIDFGVSDDDHPGRFVCGIECDGATYHSAATARDRDRLRGQVLQGLGWELHRVWSTDWWNDPRGQTDRLLKKIELSRKSARERAEKLDSPRPLAMTAAPLAPSRLVTTVPDEPGAVIVPTFATYARVELPPTRSSLLDATPGTLTALAFEILRAEQPLLEDDLRGRLLEAFGHEREGSKIRGRLDALFASLHSDPDALHSNGEWRISGALVAPRSRQATGLLLGQIPESEWDAAVVSALQFNPTLSLSELASVIVEAFGFKNVTAIAKECVTRAVDRLSASERIVCNSVGVALATRVPVSGQTVE